MELKISRQGLLRLGLMIGLAVAITVMIAPNLNLVPARYEEGDIITENIVISDEVSLVDQRSTESRRQAALAEFPPIYDFDPLLKNKTVESVRKVFQDMRGAIDARRKSQTEALQKIRNNSLAQLETLADQNGSQARSQVLDRQAALIINEIGSLGDADNPSPKLTARLDKLRFDLMAVEAQRTNTARERDQLAAKLNDLKKESEELTQAETQLRLGEEQALGSMKAEFESALGTTVEGPGFAMLYEGQFSKNLAEQVNALLIAVYDKKIVASLEGFVPKTTVIQIQTLESNQLERFEALDTVTDVGAVREQVEKLAQEFNLARTGPPYQEGIVSLAQRLIRPNLTENKGETERLKQDLLKNLSPVYFNLKKGDVVARTGEIATAQQVEIIRALDLHYLTNPQYPQIIGTFLIVLLALGLCYRLMRQHNPQGFESFSRLMLMSLLVLVSLGFAQLVLVVVPALTTIYVFIPPSTFNYLIPGALTAMLASILLTFEIAVFLGFVVSLCLAILLDSTLGFFFYALAGSFVASIPLQHYQSRFSLWQQGLRISVINVVVLGVLALLEQKEVTWQLGWEWGAAALNGLGVAFLTATLLPLIEKLFDITTNLRLLELSNMNHPALKELSVRAPGTYHHSIVVGNLSESAAEGIAAKPLLVRVASYYHDLGKMLCPLYFIENQSRKNYHDDLPAHTSARIIVNHVKDGLEIARRYKLGKAIMDIIAQHHGNSLVRYFFHKAQEEQGDLGDPVNEADFRYPGPKPQSKEAGLVMVADVTEAATRSLSDPSPESIHQMVQKLTTRIYTDGQLDESGMTFNDLNYVEKTFTKMLVSIHHHRIAYPDLPPGEARTEIETEAEQSQQDPADRDQLGSRRASS